MNAYRDQYAQLFKDGRNVILLAVSTDADTTLASWARDAQYPFLFLSDPDGAVGRAYGATVPGRTMDSRNLFIVRNGQVVERMIPFREVDPQAYSTLAASIERLTPSDSTGR